MAGMELPGRGGGGAGGASGIGRALARRFAAEGATVVVADVQRGEAAAVAGEIGGLAVATDASREAAVAALVAQATDTYGRIDLFCSNAGIGGGNGGVEVPNEDWQRIW